MLINTSPSFGTAGCVGMPARPRSQRRRGRRVDASRAVREVGWAAAASSLCRASAALTCPPVKDPLSTRYFPHSCRYHALDKRDSKVGMRH